MTNRRGTDGVMPGSSYRRRLPWLLALTASALLLAAPARATDGRIELAGHRVALELPTGWDAAERTPANLIASYRHPGGDRLLLYRVDYSNSRVWRKRSRKSFLAQVYRGFAGASTGFRRLYKKSHRLSKVHTLDIGARRSRNGGPELVSVRFLFFRRYTIIAVAAASAPKRRGVERRELRRLRTITDSVQPFFGDTLQ